MKASTERLEKAKKRAFDLLEKMTLTEKVGQLSQFGNSIYGGKESYFESHYEEGKIGSYLAITGSKKTNNIQKRVIERSRLGIPVLFAADVVHGFKTTFPIPLALSCSF